MCRRRFNINRFIDDIFLFTFWHNIKLNDGELLTLLSCTL